MSISPSSELRLTVPTPMNFQGIWSTIAGLIDNGYISDDYPIRCREGRESLFGGVLLGFISKGKERNPKYNPRKDADNSTEQRQKKSPEKQCDKSNHNEYVIR